MSTLPIDIFVCTDVHFDAWARGLHISGVLVERIETTSAHVAFRARKTDHYSIVVVNSADVAAEIGMDVVLTPVKSAF